MLGTSTTELIFIRLCITGLRAIAPVSILYSGYAALRTFGVVPVLDAAPVAVEMGLFLEAAWWLLVYVPRRCWLQRPAIHPPLPSREERRKLFDKCQSTAVQPDVEGYLTHWCHHAPIETIQRENAKQFFTWAFLNGHAASNAAEEEELNEYVDKLEEAMGRKLAPGWNENVRSLRLTLDPVRMCSKPLLFQLAILIVDVASSARLWWRCGLKLYPTKSWGRVFPPRPQSLLCANRSPAKNLSYWFRPHTSKAKLPIVFLHGIGIGLYPYVLFLKELAELDPEVGILAIEVMPISFRLCHDALDAATFCAQVSSILAQHSFTDTSFTLIGHSYGTILVNYLLHSSELSGRIDSVLLIDPVCLLLHLPHVAYNFVARTPRSANEWQLWYFASRDMGVSHALSRHFFWAENIMWKEELAKVRRSAVVVSGRDLILEPRRIWGYLTAGMPVPEGDEYTKWEKSTGSLEGDGPQTVLFYPDVDHAQVFDTPERRRPLVELMGEFIEGGQISLLDV